MARRLARIGSLLAAALWMGCAPAAPVTKPAVPAVGTAQKQADKQPIEARERLSEAERKALWKTAAEHTNAASDKVSAGLSGDEAARTGLLESALAEYRLARRDWAHHVATSAPAADIWARAARGPDDWKRAEREYEARYRLADADHCIVLLTVVLGRSPSADEWEEARRTATDVRDSKEATTYLQPAAYILVDLAEQRLVEQDALFKRTNGAQGVARRTNLPRITDDTGKESYRREPVPPIVLAAIAARDDYLSRVPPVLDSGGDAPRYAFQSADDLFHYGQFEEARKRFSVLYDESCRKNEWGYRAWERLITMSYLDGDLAVARKLAESALQRSCALTEDERVGESRLARPLIVH